MVCWSLATRAQWFPNQNWLEKNFAGVELYSVSPHSDIGVSSKMTLGVEVALAGIYFSAGSNRDHAEEKRYGAGGTSNRHFVSQFSVGYLYTFWKKEYRCLDILPYFTIQKIEDRMEDAYYGQDKVTEVHRHGDVGIGLAYVGKYIAVTVKGGGGGIAVGISMSFTGLFN